MEVGEETPSRLLLRLVRVDDVSGGICGYVLELLAFCWSRVVIWFLPMRRGHVVYKGRRGVLRRRAHS